MKLSILGSYSPWLEIYYSTPCENHHYWYTCLAPKKSLKVVGFWLASDDVVLLLLNVGLGWCDHGDGQMLLPIVDVVRCVSDDGLLLL